MVETDTFTYSKKKPESLQTPDQLLLITPERTQKLDLLIHLITNLPQALVVCGPKGIGKTTLLSTLLDRKLDNWLYCQVNANAELSFESLQERLNQVFKSGKQSSLSQELLRIQSINRKLVLLIDNAGSLVPGLVTAIIQFAWANPALRIVFAMTPDDAHVKSSTDHLINDCHFVEIPPLSESQCGVFLQQLAVKSWPQLPLGAINEHLTRQVYKETHGIPGQIITALPGMTKRKRSISSFALLMVAVVGLVGLALGVQWYTNIYLPSQPKPQPASVITPSITEKPALPSPVASSNAPVQISDRLLDQVVAKDERVTPSVNTEHASADKPSSLSDVKPVTAVPVATEPVKPIETPPVESTPKPVDLPEQDTGMSAWLSKQAPEHYTLQVMVLSKQDSVKAFTNKYPNLSQDLVYTKIMLGKKEKFLVYYGAFPDSASANKAKQSLPAEFRHSIIKKISSIKK